MMANLPLLHSLLLLLLFSLLCECQASPEVSSEDSGLDAADKDLVEAVEVLLSRMNERTSSTEKRGSIPLCGMGERCALRFGPRIGKLCDCGRGSSCNSYLLKCL